VPKQYIMNYGSFNPSHGIYRPVLDNILSFEVEDRFHVDNPDIEPADIRSRIIPLIMHLLDLLDDQKAKATFFVLGWVARKFPEVVALIDSRGNEIASHGFTHGDVRKMPLERFRDELIRSKEILEEIIGKPVYGYKAAASCLEREHLDYYRAIAEAGYRYDCSLLSVGLRDNDIRPFQIKIDDKKSVTAIPQSTRKTLGVSFRFGENMRVLPSWFGVNSIKSLNDQGLAAMVNLKLWEFDPHQPRPAGTDIVQFGKYGNLNIAEEKLARLLDYFRFTTCAEVLKLEAESKVI
jgi:polysaccharide deacetylase family protein (PEP-CTERM system associated)